MEGESSCRLVTIVIYPSLDYAKYLALENSILNNVILSLVLPFSILLPVWKYRIKSLDNDKLVSMYFFLKPVSICCFCTEFRTFL